MMTKLALGLAGLALLAPAMAQDAAEETEIRRYTVEVIIFRYAQDVGTGSEVFLPDEPEEPLFDDVPLAGEDSLETLPEPLPELEQPLTESEPLPEIEFARLMPDDFQLGDMYGRLDRLQAYEPVMHFGWTQATWPKEQTEPIPLHRFARPPADLDGSLTLYLSRFLHLVVDLEMRASSEPPVFLRIQEDRILRNGELRYYDHPRFGVLAKVTRVEEPDDDGELLGYPIQ